MKLPEIFRALLGKKRRRRVKRRTHQAHGQLELQHAPIELEFTTPTERPPISARPIQVQGTFGRNAVDPPRKRRR